MDKFESYLTMLARDANARNNFLRSMGHYAQMSEKAMLTNIRSYCDQIPLSTKRRYLDSLQVLSQRKAFQSQKVNRRIRHLTNILSAHQGNKQFLGFFSRPGLGYGRGLGVGPGLGYRYGYRRGFGGGLLSSLIALFILGALF